MKKKTGSIFVKQNKKRKKENKRIGRTEKTEYGNLHSRPVKFTRHRRWLKMTPHQRSFVPPVFVFSSVFSALFYHAEVATIVGDRLRIKWKVLPPLSP